MTKDTGIISGKRVLDLLTNAIVIDDIIIFESIKLE
jgi:hypothetical protein